MIGVALLSFFVWQHHLFQSGINPDMRPLFMLTTELISIPTGFIFLVGAGDALEGEDHASSPRCSSASGMFFNFLIGGVTGVFLSDVPVNVTVHGSFFVLAHFHYTIMGGLVFAFFGGLYYWLPKMTGQDAEQEARASGTSGRCSSSSTSPSSRSSSSACSASRGGSSSTPRTCRR